MRGLSFIVTSIYLSSNLEIHRFVVINNIQNKTTVEMIGSTHKNMSNNYDGQRKRVHGPANTNRASLPRRMFMKLIKDENAKIRNKRDVVMFIQGMNSFDSKTELLNILDDKRNLGTQRLEDCLSMLETVHDIDTILIPIVQNILHESTRRPLYRNMVNRVVSAIFHVPELLSFISENEFANLSSVTSACVFCSFLEAAVMILVEARNSEVIKEMARALRHRKINGSHKLCSLLLVDRTNVRILDNTIIDGTDGSGKNVACWVSDLKPPGGRHDNDFDK